MTEKTPPINWNTQIIDLKTGYPTQAFITFIEALVQLGLVGLSDTNIVNPADGQQLTYNAAQKKWIAA